MQKGIIGDIYLAPVVQTLDERYPLDKNLSSG